MTDFTAIPRKESDTYLEWVDKILQSEPIEELERRRIPDVSPVQLEAQKRILHIQQAQIIADKRVVLENFQAERNQRLAQKHWGFYDYFMAAVIFGLFGMVVYSIFEVIR